MCPADTETRLPLSVCLLPSQSLSCPLHLLLSNFKQNYTFPFTSFFFSSILAVILPLLANHRHPKRAHTHLRCQLVFEHSCMQLPATRRYLQHETLLPRAIYQIYQNSSSMNAYKPAKCVCVRVYTASGIPHTMHQRVESCLSLAKKTTCFLSHLHQSDSSPLSILDFLRFWHPCHTYNGRFIGCTCFL